MENNQRDHTLSDTIYVAWVFILFSTLWIAMVFTIPRGFAPTPILNIPSFVLLAFCLFSRAYSTKKSHIFKYGIGLAYIFSIYFSYAYNKFFIAVFGALKFH